jgi:energy-coupling factor transporter ATP-binding protein EcfA2
MIRFDDVSFRYDGARSPVLDRVSLEIPEGELCLVVGPTGSGKSTLLKAINGLVPHTEPGTMRGTVTVDGRTTRERVRGEPSYDAQLRAFVAAVRDGQPFPTTPRDAVVTMRLIDDIYRAAGLPLRGTS